MSGMKTAIRQNCGKGNRFSLEDMTMRRSEHLGMTAQAAWPRLQVRQAFTLVELLVVMGIIALLASMVLSFVTLGQRSSDENSTRALLSTVATALNEFVSETGAVPLPTGSKDDPESGSWYPVENTGSWEKQQLWWRLATPMTVEQRTTLYEKGREADLAADPYQGKNEFPRMHSAASRNAEFKNAMDFVGSEYGYTDGYFAANYRRNRGNTGWLSGDDGYGSYASLSVLGWYKTKFLAIRGAIAKDLTERRYLTHPCLELDERYVKDQSIVDAWGRPLIYVAHSTVRVPAAQPGYVWPMMESPAHGRNTLSDRNADGTIDRLDWDVQPPEMSEPIDHNGDGAVNDADTVFKYDRNADGDIDNRDWASVLWNAIPGHENSYFLASAGIDGEFNVLVTGTENEDNINFLEDYND